MLTKLKKIVEAVKRDSEHTEGIKPYTHITVFGLLSIRQVCARTPKLVLDINACADERIYDQDCNL